MLEIRDQQMYIFEEDSLRRWIMDYLCSSYPVQTERAGKLAINELVEMSIASARSRGIKDPHALRKYAHITFLLGNGFERDAECAWALAILNNSRFVSDASRLRVLEDEAVKRLAESPEEVRAQ